MNKKVLGVSLVLIILLSCLVSAGETSLLVKTGKQCRVSVNVLRAGTEYELIEAIHQDTNSEGDVATTISSRYAEVNILVVMKKNGIEFFEEEFGPYSIREPIVIDLRPEEEKNPPVKNVTIVEENATPISEEVIQTENENKSSTGFAIKNLTEVVDKYQIIIYSFMVVVVVFGTFLFFKKFRKKKEKVINVKKLSDFMNEQSQQQQTESSSSELFEAKRKLDEAQREIRKLENREKIVEARKKLEETQREIERLERGE